MTQTTKLLQPYTFRSGLIASHRITLAPLTNTQSGEDGICSAEELHWLERRAEGGFSIVMTCASHVSMQGKGFDGQLGCFGEQHVPGLATIATAIRNHGALSMVQLYHGGVRSPSRLTGLQPVSAGTWTEDRPGFEAPRTLETSEVEQIVEDFVAAAHRCHRAGFDGVELHGAHGYLLSQFLSSAWNQRTDAWGGTLAGRARLVRTIAQRIRNEIPRPFTLGVRLSPEDYLSARGLDLDENVQVAQWLAEDGVDFIHLSLWDYRRNTQKRPDQHALPVFRAALPADVAIFGAGGIWSRADADAVIDKGADFIALGRAAIVQPDWPKLARESDYQLERGPRAPDYYRDVAISDRFVTYLRGFKNMVSES